MSDECRCAACLALEAEVGGPGPVLDFYRRRLLHRGWAGRKSSVEKAYQRAHATWGRHDAERGRRLVELGVGKRFSKVPSGEEERRPR